VPPTFGELAALIFRSFLPPVRVVHFVTDTYPDVSIKCFEQQQRGTSTTCRIGGPKTKTPADWKSFLRHSASKTQFTEFLLEEWRTDACAKRLEYRQVYFICGKQCFLLSSNGLQTVCTNQPELLSNQQEADTRIILHMLFADNCCIQPCALLVLSPDTDVFILLLYYVNQVSGHLLFETGAGSHRRCIDVQRVASAIGIRMCMALPALHCFTGCDTTSAFVRKGKRKCFDLLESALCTEVKSTASKATLLTCLAAFESLGSVKATVSDYLVHVLEQFVCLLYGKSACRDVIKARYSIFSSRYQQRTLPVASKSGIDLSLLPPCLDSLKMHCARAAYQTFVWHHAHESMQNVPSPSGHGWKFLGNELHVDWFAGNMLLHDVIELLAERSPSDDAVNDAALRVNVGEYEDVEEDGYRYSIFSS